MFAQALTLVSAAAVASAATLSRRETTLMTGFASSPMEWIYPPGRTGFNATTAAYDPCGNVAVSSTRTNYPMSGGQISIQSLSVAADIEMMYVNSSDPTDIHSFSSFTTTILDMSPGYYCTSGPDFTSLGYSAGTELTLLIYYELYSAEQIYYHCADITLVDDTTDASYTCSNTSTVLVMATSSDSDFAGLSYDVYNTGSATGSAATTTVTVTSSSASGGLSAAAGGGIGAVVGIIVFAGLLFAAKMGGYINFGKRRSRVTHDDAASINSSMPLKARAV